MFFLRVISREFAVPVLTIADWNHEITRNGGASNIQTHEEDTKSERLTQCAEHMNRIRNQRACRIAVRTSSSLGLKRLSGCTLL